MLHIRCHYCPQVKNIIYHTMKDVVGILTTSKAPVTKVTKTAAKSSPPKLNTHKSAAGVMATEGNTNKLSVSS